MEAMVKNLQKIMLIIALMLAALICRLAYIQIAGAEELSAATRTQSLISLEGSNTRGIIYDRNGAALVADRKHYIYIIRENVFDRRAEHLLRNLDADEVSSDNRGYKVYSSEEYDKDTGKTLIREYSAYILQAAARYSDNQTAAHLIGYVNRKDSSGAAGLELMFDEQLSAFNRHIYAAADVKGNILPGRGLIVTSDNETDSYVKSGIMTTVDKELQNAVEDIIKEESRDCAVVVLDSGGGIAAMACTPRFNPNDIASYLDGDGDELVNKAAQGEYAPGSVFKIVTAAAALENGIGAEQCFTCDGAAEAGSLSIACETGGETGHGQIGFEQAFAESCNSFFIKLAQQTGADEIVEMAEKLGLGAKTLDGYPQESAGHLMSESERYGDAIGNLAIGQGETLVTPLQIAAMTSIIASGGTDKGVHILMEDEPGSEQVISKKTAETIGKMMEMTVTDGTAAVLDLKDEDGTPQAAVKTGTAEYADKDSVGTHAWITGYTPCSEPEYIITVFVEGGTSGAGSAGPVFQKIIEYLHESGSYSRPALA